MSRKKALTGKHNYTEFKEETIVNRVRKMVQMRDSITDADDLHVRVSYGNRKLGAVPSVSLIPVADCGKGCELCKRGCYDVRNVCCYNASQKQRANNSALLKLDRERYFREIEAHVQFHRVWRWHVGGDIKDYDYLGQVVGIAERNPHCQFLIFTKRSDLVNEWQDNVGEFPSNLHLILSGWRGDTDVNPHHLPVSSPVWKDGSQSCMVTDNAIWCPGDCTACATVNGGCWGAKKGDTILFEAH